MTTTVLKSLAKSLLIQLGLTAAESAADAGIRKKVLESGVATLIISNEDMDDIMKIVKSLEKSCLLIKGVSDTLKIKKKNKGVDFLACY